MLVLRSKNRTHGEFKPCSAALETRDTDRGGRDRHREYLNAGDALADADSVARGLPIRDRESERQPEFPEPRLVAGWHEAGLPHAWSAGCTTTDAANHG